MNIFYETIKWVQIISTAVFLVMFLGKTFYLRKKDGLNPIKLRSGDGKANRFFSILSVIIVNIWIALILLYLLSERFNGWLQFMRIELLDPPWLKIAGLVILVLAFIIFIIAQLTLGNSWRLGIDRAHPGRLVTRKIYAFSRHPIYLFFDLYFFSIFLLNANLVFLILMAIMALTLHLQIETEERFLLEIHGGEYQSYIDKVGKYITILRKAENNRISQSDTIE